MITNVNMEKADNGFILEWGHEDPSGHWQNHKVLLLSLSAAVSYVADLFGGLEDEE